jgi:hypothetical protein
MECGRDDASTIWAVVGREMVTFSATELTDILQPHATTEAVYLLDECDCAALVAAQMNCRNVIARHGRLIG